MFYFQNYIFFVVVLIYVFVFIIFFVILFFIKPIIQKTKCDHILAANIIPYFLFIYTSFTWSGNKYLVFLICYPLILFLYMRQTTENCDGMLLPAPSLLFWPGHFSQRLVTPSCYILRLWVSHPTLSEEQPKDPLSFNPPSETACDLSIS